MTTCDKRCTRMKRTKVIQIALLSRLIMVILMVITFNFLPTFNPGEDVLKFDLRFEECIYNNDEQGRCHAFCRERDNECNRLVQNNNGYYENIQRYKYLDKFYMLLLPALTRWDAARFLSIAVDPTIRHPRPPLDLDAKTFCTDKYSFTSKSTIASDYHACDETLTRSYNNFDSSEQAHAFMPLLPMSIRFLANSVLTRMVPLRFLPPTYEGTCVLSGLLLNVIAFSIAALMLYELTLIALKKSSTKLQRDDERSREDIAQLTALIFCCNPANVFFTTVYSESIFSALTFSGYLLDMQGAKVFAVLPWMMASYTRSNGSLVCAYLFLKGLGEAICILSTARSHTGVRLFFSRFLHGFLTMAFFTILAFFVVAPLLYHDWTGYHIHCHSDIHPEWCIYEITKKPMYFSLYTYVQRKHWDVGFLRYYSWNQLPNFVLATPILCLGVMATSLWIQTSWQQFAFEFEDQRQKKNAQIDLALSAANPIMNVIKWARFALHRSALNTEINGHATNEQLVGAGLLPHFAVLAGMCILGATMAHVQVSTRLICSSCPSLYWFVAFVIEHAKKLKRAETLLETETEPENFSSYRRLSKAIVYYALAFNIIGSVMYVTWLPWT